ncbi:MAG: hypothetical protein ACK5L6_10535 [Anaerorhabdus sp.]
MMKVKPCKYCTLRDSCPDPHHCKKYIDAKKAENNQRENTKYK